MDQAPTGELWGTFAVDDHLRERAFVAEVILFDRLVIPQPPDDDKEEYRRWIANGWRPDQLTETIRKLEEFAIPVPWDKQLESSWEQQYTANFSHGKRAKQRMNLARDASFDLQNIKRSPPDHPAMWVTRLVVANKINRQADEALFKKMQALDIDPTADIEAVIGYGSYPKFHEELPLQSVPPGVPAPDANAYLFRWDFLVPEGSDLSDTELLERAAELGRNSEFKESRRRFHDWRRKLIAKKAPVETALGEMKRCLDIYNTMVAKSRFRSRVLGALQVLAVAAPLADLAYLGAGMAGGVAFGLGAFVTDKLMPEPQVGEREKIAALVYDAREAFGWGV